GSSRTGVKRDIKIENINDPLNEILPNSNFSHQRLRQSFDELLDFIGKLEYSLSLGIMTEDEVKYFSYYIEKCAKEEAIMTYARKYNFKSFLSLVKRLNLQCD